MKFNKYERKLNEEVAGKVIVNPYDRSKKPLKLSKYDYEKAMIEAKVNRSKDPRLDKLVTFRDQYPDDKHVTKTARQIILENHSHRTDIPDWDEIKKALVQPDLWICPKNDLEAVTIVEMLEKAENEGEPIDILVTEQSWGASWENLEPEIKAKIEEARSKGRQIYGVELQGDSKGAVNIDHHIYGDDDRSNPQASIEQVADVLGVDLTLEQKFIAANDKGFIPEMQRLGAELGLEGEDLQAIIDNVRMKDRMAQGITAEQEAQAIEAIEVLGDLSEKRELIIMDLPHSKTATVTDRLFGKYDNLLVTCGDGETNFFGTTDIINALNEKYKQVDENGNSNCWCGGQLDKGNGYWGGKEIDQDSVKETVASEVEKSKKVDLNR